MIKLYDHFVFYYMLKKFKQESLQPGKAYIMSETNPLYQNCKHVSRYHILLFSY